ncbi:MAG: hypothetical protein HY690_13365 [Chloroflexi bacterium]|nr:hypothetical protein [Chloroflexota bacterium]
MLDTQASTQSTSFERLAGLCAMLAGVAGFLYSVAFIIIARSAPDLGGLLSALFLMLGGLLSTAALVAVYQRLREIDAAFALWGLVLGLVGALGSAIHGGYDLANAINPPAAIPANLANLPSPIDPRGLLTFGVAGLALLVVSSLIVRGHQLPRSLGFLGYVLAVLFLVLYLGRLIVLDATNPMILGPALLAGFIVNPAWYLWLGVALWRNQGV